MQRQRRPERAEQRHSLVAHLEALMIAAGGLTPAVWRQIERRLDELSNDDLRRLLATVARLKHDAPGSSDAGLRG